MKSSAKLSPCRKYRYQLERVWDEKLSTCAFVMLNPSTADEQTDDRTIKKCMKYANSWGFGGILVVNLFGLRATDPREIKMAGDPVGGKTDVELLKTVSEAKLTVCAWGNHGDYMGRSKQVVDLLRRKGIETFCLKKTKSGEPNHPLYLSPKILKKDLLRL